MDDRHCISQIVLKITFFLHKSLSLILPVSPFGLDDKASKYCLYFQVEMFAYANLLNQHLYAYYGNNF